VRIIKLHTTDSTNNYLKEWIRINTPENLMIVVTDSQTNGRGQMGTKWLSESNKNLIFSIFIKFKDLQIEKQFKLNQAVSLGLLTALKTYIPQAQIKWPNDIMAGGKKIAGILIENTVNSSTIKHSIVGIGLNVNQTKFPREIPNASSLQLICNTEFNLDKLLLEIKKEIIEKAQILKEEKYDFIQKNYLDNLFLHNIPSTFLDKDNSHFSGTIIGVTSEGRLQIKLQNNDIVMFTHKEINFSF